MLYTKIKNTSFVASNHYNKQVKLDYQPTFLFPKRIPKPKTQQTKIWKTNKYNVNYEDYKIINELSINYLRSLKGSLSPDIFLAHLYKAELTGIHIRIVGRAGYGYVVEERVNSLYVVFADNVVRLFIKKLVDFVIELDGVEYFFFGKNLKKNRFVKK